MCHRRPPLTFFLVKPRFSAIAFYLDIAGYALQRGPLRLVSCRHQQLDLSLPGKETEEVLSCVGLCTQSWPCGKAWCARGPAVRDGYVTAAVAYLRTRTHRHRRCTRCIVARLGPYPKLGQHIGARRPHGSNEPWVREQGWWTESR